jgi:hypothetical protein
MLNLLITRGKEVSLRMEGVEGTIMIRWDDSEKPAAMIFLQDGCNAPDEIFLFEHPRPIESNEIFPL